MSARERLDRYLDEARRRLRAIAVARASAVLAVSALLLTLAAVWFLKRTGFAPGWVLGLRLTLIAVLLAAAAALLWRPLLELRARFRAQALERRLPGQQGRIETYVEATRRRDEGLETPLIDLLAEDALRIAEREPVDELFPRQHALVPAAIAGAGFVALAFLIAVGSGTWGLGSRHLWLGVPLPAEQIVVREIVVEPGDATVRRNQDLPIRAQVKGFDTGELTVHVRFESAERWESAPMQPREDGGFEFTLYALREPFSYYVSAGATKSAEHRVTVADPPRIERVRLTYNFPEWTGLPPRTVNETQDIEAVAGTQVTFDIETSEPLEAPALDVNGTPTPLEVDGTRSRGTLVVNAPGQYRITTRLGDELVPLTDEHQIALVADEKPTIEVAKPGRDWRATSIEEVPVLVRARDDFRVQGIELHYSVNGGEWQVVKLPARAREVEANTLLRLEELATGQPASHTGDMPRLKPGDIVTYYAVARDRRQSAQSDLFLIQVQPFERRFTQAQGGGGGGMGGEQENAISERQREILLATWNLQRARESSRGREAERIGDNARMLAELQGTLAAQARTLIERTQARALTAADPNIRAFVENLQLAVQAMEPAARDLGEIRLQEAIPSEQKALQHLLRAEALITDIQVAFQRDGGGGSQAGRDLAEMFELEMDLEKNQYETESRVSADASSSRELEEAIRKLRELAQRQERLAREAERNRQTPEMQRWRQEQLRREAEDLRRRLAELAQRSGRQQQQSGSRQGQQSSSSSSGDPAAEALSQVESALETMRSATAGAQGGQQSSLSRSAQEASERLRRAAEQMERGRREGLANQYNELAARAQRLLEQQRESESELQSALAQAGLSDSQGNRLSRSRLRALDWDRMQALAERKRALQNELQALERDMRNFAQRNRERTPQAAEQIGNAAAELGERNVSGGLARSALELERGRVLEPAARDPLITEALESLELQLGQAARVAATETERSERGAAQADPEELLAELAELRRAWAQAQAQARQPGRGERGSSREGQAGEGETQDAQATEGGQSGERTARGGRTGGPGGDTWGGAWSAIDGGYIGGYDGDYARHLIEGERGRRDAWNPPLAANAARPADPEALRERAEEIGRRLRELIERMPRDAMPATDIAALRQLADRLRRGNIDPMESEYGKMLALVDQVELAALGAVERARGDAATRAGTPAADSPQYRETVAEYYRRLGARR
ncbi:MAG: DUF4175 family protein [Pseudomonadota bacterium]